jgi:hypothetical protein
MTDLIYKYITPVTHEFGIFSVNVAGGFTNKGNKSVSGKLEAD